MSNQDDEEFSLAGLQALDVDPETVTAYEVAVDLLNEVIGIHSGKLRDARRSDPDAVAALSAASADYVATRNALRPDDRARVAQVRWECSEIIKRQVEQRVSPPADRNRRTRGSRMHHEPNACHFCGRFALEVEGWAESVQAYRSMRAPWDDEQPFFDGGFHLSCVRSFDRREEFRAELVSWICAGVHTIPVRGADGTINPFERIGMGYSDKVYSGAVGDIYEHPGSQDWVFVECEGPVHFLDLDDAQALCHRGFVRGSGGGGRALLSRDPGADVAEWGLRELLDFLDIQDLYQVLLDELSPEYAFLGGGRNRFGYVLEYALSCIRRFPDEVDEYFRQRLG